MAKPNRAVQQAHRASKAADRSHLIVARRGDATRNGGLQNPTS